MSLVSNIQLVGGAKAVRVNPRTRVESSSTGAVTHHIEGASHPNDVGTDQQLSAGARAVVKPLSTGRAPPAIGRLGIRYADAVTGQSPRRASRRSCRSWPSVRVAGRSAQEATARAARPSVTTTCQAASWHTR